MAVADVDTRAATPQLTASAIRSYLESRLGARLEGVTVTQLGATTSADLKGYGYGTPLRVDYQRDGRRGSAVLETIAPGPFGHEHMADRARILLWSHAAFNRLPGHVRSLDVGAVRRNGDLISLADASELFVLNEFVEGNGYYRDLERLRDGAALRDLDIARADALCDYLVDIHRVRGSNPELYVRRLRELVGDSECIAGIIDSYPANGAISEALERIEHACLRWRWRLKPLTHRLRQVHGDFHPWNVLFDEGAHFVALDRSRGEWGEPADDVASMAMNYVFFSLQRSQRLEGAFDTLFGRFWDRYLAGSGDRALARVIAPFIAFRGLVMANPLWYPNLPETVRAQLLGMVEAVLARPEFDPRAINEYCRAR